jgi:hypothetical protein
MSIQTITGTRSITGTQYITSYRNFVNRVILVKPGYPGTRVSRPLLQYQWKVIMSNFERDIKAKWFDLMNIRSSDKTFTVLWFKRFYHLLVEVFWHDSIAMLVIVSFTILFGYRKLIVAGSCVCTDGNQIELKQIVHLKINWGY